MNHKMYEYSYQLKKERRQKVTLTVFYIFLLFTLINIISNILIYPVKQVSDSMIPDVPEEGFVLVTPLDKTPERGDVYLISLNENKKRNIFYKIADFIVKFFTAQQFHIDLSKDSKFVSNNDYQLRRVLGLPGDTIYMRDYVLYVKPATDKHFLTEFEVTKKPYNVTFYSAPAGWDTNIGVQGTFEEFTLGSDEYFILGDNRKGCSDSRLWGPVKIEQFKGRALVNYFPFNGFKFF